MRITWVTRSFLDYRIPVYQEIDKLCGHQLTVIYFAEVVPERCQTKLKNILGDRAIGLSGEFRIGGQKTQNQAFANTGGIRIPIRPGLVRIIRQTKPHIILSDGFFQWTYAALLARAFWGIPHLMCYERTLHTERNASRIRTIFRKIASLFIDGINYNGVETKKYLLKFGFPENKLFAGNMAADTVGVQKFLDKISKTDIENFKKKHSIRGKLFLYTGQLIQRKGILELLYAWRIFTSQGLDATLMLVGDGDKRLEVIKYISKNNLNNVRIVSKVDYDQIVSYYAAADIFIIPTLEDNWSLVVPEAMSCGLPIICSKYNGCWPELVKPDNGWVFDPLNPLNFLETFEKAWTQSERWEEMGERSKEIVKEYSPEKIANEIFKGCLATTNS